MSAINDDALFDEYEQDTAQQEEQPFEDGLSENTTLQSDSETVTELAELTPDEVGELMQMAEEVAKEEVEEAAKPKKRTRKKKPPKDESEFESEETPAEDTDVSHDIEGDSENNDGIREPQQRERGIATIDNERTVESERDRKRNELIDLFMSLKSRRVLTGTIQGVERSENNPDLCFAVLFHGDFKIVIPCSQCIGPPQDFRERDPGDFMFYLLTKRIGSEIDYLVKGIDEEEQVVAASRFDAMKVKRKQYSETRDDGTYDLHEGRLCEARVVSTIRPGIFVELFGVETYIPLRELSYQRLYDARQHFDVGQRILVKIIELERKGKNNILLEASVKQVEENPVDKIIKKYGIGNRYIGTVSLVSTSGVFVELDGGVDCLCAFPERGRPMRGGKVTVRIRGADMDEGMIWGNIVHMAP